MKKVIIFLMIGILLFTLGGCQMTDTESVITKEKQIEFLKSHKQEITDYIKSQNPKVVSVRYDWDSVDMETVGNGTPQGGGTAVTISGFLNTDKNLKFTYGYTIFDESNFPSKGSYGNEGVSAEIYGTHYLDLSYASLERGE